MSLSLFDVDLFAVGEEGAGFRYDDTPTYLTGYRRSGMALRARLAREIQVRKGSGLFETLLVLSFGFITTSSKNRFHNAEITLTFAPTESSASSYVQIVSVSPNDTNSISINATPRCIESSLTWGGNAYLVTPIGPVAGRPLEISTKSTFQVTDMGRITGDSYPDGIRSQTRDTVAIFTLSENAVQKQGIPSHFTVALLLRSDGNEFSMETEIKAKAGLLYNMAEATEKLFGRVPKSKSIPFPVKPESKVLLKWEKVHGEIDNESKLKKVMLDELTEFQEAPLLAVEEVKKTGA
ncbi:hypothetical protein QBC37DRAFT_447592 [Rhypophila decipiens]|uniref:Uncharacterized protein n=1 Tax=Rhypophila decipiens TaxID=261697 RepID=A0AAN6Y1M2_9PEZI|nr:hypothetical protein QBC37DRAFT_447592 [Rhypophila decipiens]